MTIFDERERAYEKKFSLDQELKFKAEARRNKLVAEWAAAKLGLSAPAISDYVKQVVKADLSDPGQGAYLKVKTDLEDKHVGISDGELRRAMTQFLVAAVRQIEDAPSGKS
jgi:hypothetical protein